MEVLDQDQEDLGVEEKEVHLESGLEEDLVVTRLVASAERADLDLEAVEIAEGGLEEEVDLVEEVLVDLGEVGEEIEENEAALIDKC